MQAQRGGGHAPFDALQTNAQIAGQHHIGGPAIHAAVQRTNGHRAHGGQGIGDFFKKSGPMPRLVKPANVVPGTKHRPGLARGVGRQDQNSHIVGLVHGVNVRQQGFEVAVFQAVALCRAVQSEGGHAPLDLKNRGGRNGKGL